MYQDRSTVDGRLSPVSTVSTDGQQRYPSRAEAAYRTACAVLAALTGIYAAIGVLLGWALFSVGDVVHPTEGRMFLLGALACLGAALWAAVLARPRSPHRGSTVLVGAVGGLLLTAGSFYLYGGGASARPPKTTIGLAFVGVQVAAVPVVAWILGGLPDSSARPPTSGTEAGHASPSVPPAAAEPGARRRFRHRVSGFALLTGLALFGGTAIYGLGTRQIEAHETITHQVTAVFVRSGSGDITVHGTGAAGTVELIRRARLGAWGDLPPYEFSSGDNLELGPRKDNDDDWGISYEIRVPAGVKVNADTVYGNIDADGEFSTVGFQSAYGHVKADLSASTVDAYVFNGGSVNLRLRVAPAQLTTDADTGDVDVRLPGDQAYAVETRSGGVPQVTVQQDSRSPHRIKATSGSGAVTVQPG